MKPLLVSLTLALGAGCTSLSGLHDEVRFGNQEAAFELADAHSDNWRPVLAEVLGDATPEVAGARLACDMSKDRAAYFSLIKAGDGWLTLCWAFAPDGEWLGFGAIPFQEDLSAAALAAHDDGALIVIPQEGEEGALTYEVLPLHWNERGGQFMRE